MKEKLTAAAHVSMKKPRRGQRGANLYHNPIVVGWGKIER